MTILQPRLQKTQPWAKYVSFPQKEPACTVCNRQALPLLNPDKRLSYVISGELQLQEALIVSHQHLRFDLLYCLKDNANYDDQ